MTGWRARLGVMVPSANTVVESTYNQLSIDGVSFHYSRIKITADTKEEIEGMIDQVPRSADELADAGVDVISFACTAGSFVGGRDYDKKIIDKIEKTGIKGTTTSTAAIKALNSLSLNKIIIATPYLDWINEKLKKFFQQNGFEVLDIQGLKYESAEAQGSYPPEKIYRMVKDMHIDEAEGVFISCTNFRAVEAIERLEKDLKIPIVTSNQATLWDMLQIANIKEKIGSYGKLLK